jgi:predicted NBD/HSP70 family sugar kinase
MARKRAVNTSLIRALNVARVFHALRLKPGSSQRELAGMTGLDKATISAVVAELELKGVLYRSARGNVGRPGRPEVGLAISADAGTLIGVCLEPDVIRLIATTLSGEKLLSLQLSGSMDVETAAARVVEGVTELLGQVEIPLESIKGMGVGVPALMDRTGSVVFAPNLGWRQVPIREILSERFPFTVYLDNDTKAAALAEKLFGACQEVEDFIFIAGHSGVGGGLYLGGTLYRGDRGFAGELGHIKVRKDGRLCSCGARGCLEAYISQAAIITRLAEEGLHAGDLFEVARLAEARDPRALTVLHETGEVLGEACSDLVNILNPERIVLGGNYALVAPYALEAMKRSLQRDSLPAPLATCEVVVSPLGPEAVPMGGVGLALEGVLSLPSWLSALDMRRDAATTEL